ncbi:hypothetical protein [Pseudonocardia phyllosphaerae]|uniref:hypothetical protein n=1 Tax=Pseudonocardia phyllosphaerae TaxID=3390502 RepID=UPI00397CACDC
MSLWRRILGGGDPLPDDVALAPDETVAGTATVAGGGTLVVTSWGVHPPGGGRIGWHEIAKAVWDRGSSTLVVTPAAVEEVAPGIELLADDRPRRFRLTGPGPVPKAVQDRVTQSIRSRHRRDLPGGGAWVLQRRVPGGGGLVLQVRPDPGTDPIAVRRLAEGLAGRLGELRPGGDE